MSVSQDTATDLPAYLTARWDEEEAAALAAIAEAEHMHPPLSWRWAVVDSWTSTGMPPGAPSPQQVIADIAAKRAILAMAVACADLRAAVDHHPPGTFSVIGEVHGAAGALGDVLHHLAQPYVSRPDFNPAWLDD